MQYPGASYWISALQLTPHPEGGYYRRSYTAETVIPATCLPEGFRGSRPVATAIYYLLEHPAFSALHRITSDELWHFYCGDPLMVTEIGQDCRLRQHLLGNVPGRGQQFQCMVRAGSWFGAALLNGDGYALVGCTVAPGFAFEDFELARRKDLVQQYPAWEDIITALTH